MRGPGAALVVAGLVLVALGLLWSAGLLRWFGRLPGDLRLERESVRVYVPLVSMLLVSLGLSLVMWLWRKLGG